MSERDLKLTDDETIQEPKTVAPPKLTTLSASLSIARKGLPFGLSRMFMSSFASLGVAFTLRNFGPDEVAAGPYILSVLFVATGLIRGVLSSIGLLVGRNDGQQNYAEVGKVMRQGWLLSVLLSTVTYLLLGFAGYALKAMGVDENAADNAQDFFNGYLFGVTPLFLYICDAQLASATKNGMAALISGMAYAVLSAVFGVPAALGYFGKFFEKAFGLGFGISAAGWATMISLRAYFAYNKAHYGKYELYKNDFGKNLSYLKELFSLGLKMGAQVATEWGNLTALTILLGATSNENAKALQASLNCLACFNLLIIGFGQAMGQLMSSEFGAMKKALTEQRPEHATVHRQNFNRLSYGGLIVGAIISSLFAVTTGPLADKFASVFLSSEGRHDPALVRKAGDFLILNAIGIIPDAIRNLASGALQAYKDIMMPTVVSFVSMSAIGLSLAAALMFTMGVPATTAVIIRDVSILFASALIARKLVSNNKLDESKMQAKIEFGSQSSPGCGILCSSAFWRRNKSNNADQQPLLEDKLPNNIAKVLRK